jgi:spore germination protein
MKKIAWIIATVAVIFIVYHFSVQEKNTRLENALAVQYSNQLTSSSEKLVKLSEAIDQTLIFTDKTALEKPLDDVWRISSDIRASISALPLGEETSTQWMNYLNRIGNGASQVRNGKVPLEDWQKSMTTARSNLITLSNEWAFNTKDQGKKDYLVRTFVNRKVNDKNDKSWQALGNSVKAYTESDFPMTASETDQQKKKDLEHIRDSEVSENQIKEKFIKFFPALKDATLHITESSKDAPYPFYHVEFHKGIRIGYADFTKRGGHLLSYLLERPFEDTSINVEKMKEKAKGYLKAFNYADTTIVDYRENNIAWHVANARVDKKNDALVYADGIQLKIAKDNGELLGLNAMEYIQEENIPTQPVVPVDYHELFTSDFVVEEEKLAYVENDQLQQRLAFEVLTRNDTIGTYKIYIDTESHEILQSEKLP